MKEHRARQAEERLAAGPQWIGCDEYVFTTGWGGPVHPDTVSSLIGDLIRARNVTAGTISAGELLPHAPLHDLRHVHATTLLLAGVPVHVVAARLGHADPSVTLRVYAHVVREQVAAAADIFARSIQAGDTAAVSKSVSKRAAAARPKPSDLAGALGGTRTPNLLIRRSGQVVQARPSMVVGWADIPELSTCVGCCSAAWLQSWLQSRRYGADPRPSAFQAGHIPSCGGSCECYALSPIAAGRLWAPVLLSPLLSAQPKSSGGKPTRTAASTRDRGREAAQQHELLFGLGQYGVDADLIFCQAGTLGRVGLRLAPGLRLASGVFSVAGHGSLVLGVGVPHCLPDSPDEVFKLTSRDVEPDPPVWVDPHLALVPAETHPMMELPEPGVLDRVVLPRARPAAADGDLQFDQSFAGLVDGADPGDGAGIVPEGIWGVDHAVHSA